MSWWGSISAGNLVALMWRWYVKWFENVNWFILSFCCVKVFTVKRLIFTFEQLIQAFRTGPATINSLISHRGHPSCQHLTAQAVTWLRQLTSACLSINHSVTSKYCDMAIYEPIFMNSLSWLSSWFEPPERKPVQTQILTRPGAEPHPPTSSFCLALPGLSFL